MKKRHIFLDGIICAVILYALFFAGRWAFFNVIHSDDILDGLVDLRTAVMTSMEAGEESAVFYVENVEINDISNINRYVDSAFGTVETYKIIISSGEYLAIEFSYERSENYYVVRKVLYGEDIPSDNIKAQEVYNAYMNFYEQCINEPMSDFEKEIAAHDYIVKNCVYGFPEDEEDAYDAYGVLVSGKAVCDGYAEAFFLMMTCLDIDCDIIVGMADDQLHAWNQVELDGNWYNVDITWDDSIPDTGNLVKHTYVNIDDAALAVTHTWEAEFYHTCESNIYNYYVKTLAAFDDYDSFKTGILQQISRGSVLEGIIYNYSGSDIDLTFLYETAAIRSVKYMIEDMGNYSVIVVYINS